MPILFDTISDVKVHSVYLVTESRGELIADTRCPDQSLVDFNLKISSQNKVSVGTAYRCDSTVR